MARDLRKLRQSDAVRILNASRLGTVVTDRQFRAMVNAAGLRVCGSEGVDLFALAAWLCQRRRAKSRRAAPGPGGYEAKKLRAAERERVVSRSAREIGELPEVEHQARRDRAADDFRFFCEAYFPATFNLPWSDDHLKVIEKIETAVRYGGQFAMAMPRGNGKTVLTEAACLWALLYGYHEFVALIGADEEHAEQTLQNLKAELEFNDRLAGDFPEACIPIRSLEGINQRRLLYRGEPVRMKFTNKRIVLPNIEGSVSAEAVVSVSGITGRIRGMNYKRTDGRTVRPSLAVIDDPQTDESAKSPAQCAERERILTGAVLGLAGPGRKISAVMPCTVVYPDDLADRVLDRQRHPEWQGIRTQLVYRFPTNLDLWEQYAVLRSEGMRDGGDGGRAATEFYRDHREAMDSGAVVAWPARFDPDELSAIQNAMNLRIDRKESFYAEYQNEPQRSKSGDAILLTADQVAERWNGLAAGVAPAWVDHVTAMIDVHDSILYWTVAGWSADFTGAVLDYGTFPEQNRRYFAHRGATRTLGEKYPEAGREGAILAGLIELTDRLLSREWTREDQVALRIGRCLIDAGYADQQVYACCRRSKFGAVIAPSRGLGIKAAQKPLAEWKLNPGDRRGHFCQLVAPRRGIPVRYFRFDANYWKSFVMARLATPLGEVGALSLFGKSAAEHRMYADHLTAETPVRVTAQGRTVDEWALKPNRDNHWLDTLVGCAVAASTLGVSVPALKTVTATAKPTVKRKRTRVQYIA